MAKRIVVGVTGASGSILAERLVGYLVGSGTEVDLVVTDAGRQVALHELVRHEGFCLLDALEGRAPPGLELYGISDLFAPFASGSNPADVMVVVPCSMGSLARIALGVSGNLLERAADVMLKQRRPLVLCPRESPFGPIHLRNMLDLAQAGVHIVAPIPAFYHKPRSIDELIDFLVGRILDSMGIENSMYGRWHG